jgi:transposase
MYTLRASWEHKKEAAIEASGWLEEMSDRLADWTETAE